MKRVIFLSLIVISCVYGQALHPTKIVGSVPAGQADGSDNPGCPPAKCGDLQIKNLPPVMAGSSLVLQCADGKRWASNQDIKYIDGCIQTSVYTGAGKRAHWSQCTAVAGVSPWWDCPYSRFDYLRVERDPTGSFTITVRFRNWANYGQRIKLSLTYLA